MARLFLGNLPFDTSEEEIRDMMKDYKPTTVSMPKDRETGRFRGFAFVDVEEADRAISELNGGEFGGRSLKVNIATERPPRSSGGGDHGGRREFHKRDRGPDKDRD